MKTRTYPQAFFLLLLAIAASFAIQSTGVRGAEVVAPPADPIIRLQGVDGKFFDIADMTGSVVLMSFGATWCEPCSRELVALEQLKKEYAAKPVKFYWVSIENPGEMSDSKLKAYAKEHKLTIPVLRDPTKTTYLQFTPRVRLPLILFFGMDGKVDGQPRFGMSSRPEEYKQSVRVELDKLLSAPKPDATK